MDKNKLWMTVALVVAIVIFVLFFWKTIIFFALFGIIAYIAYKMFISKKRETDE